MKRLLYIFLGLSLVIISALIYILISSFRDVTVENAGELRNEIAKSVKSPFNNGDTLIVSNVSGICGTVEQPIVFDTQIDQARYSQTVASQTGMKVIRSTKFGAADLVKRDTPSSSIVSGEFFAQQVSSKEVIVTETYIFNDTLKSIVKVFSYKENEWTYKIKSADIIMPTASTNQ